MKKQFEVKVIAADGTTSTTTTSNLSLGEAQRLVGGYVELVRCASGAALVNEDGLRLGLPLNAAASQLVGRPLVGAVVVLPNKCGW